ncbi:L-type lectin-domain containing receptor kinase SIT2-like [Rhododendron vialii]|uniref:L-type lectin-domain containing receptor kinase SIT2-like n=1 Tax=Rhododendron vialii TaxID=182163 RepID=UPI00265DCFBA|nr:L-type lectin-domain containing receptor kinase SIT2-like [Rhododendron vialii]XP_058201902.1 L-type lectin-domain containing receptor kinase SIT2-like [Rhododendron vialii]
MTSTPVLVYFLIHLYVCLNHLAMAVDENQFAYNGFKRANIHLDGIAKIHSNGLLQLTNFSKNQIGRAFYQHPIGFDTSSSTLPKAFSFSTHFVFAIVPEITKLRAHGIAFTISPSMDFNQALGRQYFGLLNVSSNGLPSNHLLAIEFDSILNPEFNDTNDNHVGIDVNSIASNVSATVTYYSNREQINWSMELVSGSPMQGWVEYDGFRNVLNVTLAPITSPKPDQSLLSTHINLSSILLDSMYVGFSAATGGVTGNHYILGWSFNKSGKAHGLEISELPSLPHLRKAGLGITGLGITVSVRIVAIGLTITIAGTLYMLRRKKYEEIREDWEREYGPHRFSYKDLFKATRGFIDEELLGAGGFGKVYRGVLPSLKEQVAVKKVSHDSKQGMKEFVAEIASMGRLRHRNLVQLLGYSRRKGELLLVYDYMPNGSLDKFLFSNEKPSLDWAQHYRIIRGVASALLYLHEEWDQVVLHRDAKASNVLLDADLNGRLGDFGLARLYDHGANLKTTHVVGTIGYLAPELSRTGKATTSSDVFAFGAFILEVGCGRRPIQPQQSPDEVVLVDWVFEKWKEGAILKTSDPRLGGDYLGEEMELVLKVGLLCSKFDAATRPSMRQVMQYLDGDVLLPEIIPDRTSTGTIGLCNEASSEFVMSFPSSSIVKSSTPSISSTESILICGR